MISVSIGTFVAVTSMTTTLGGGGGGAASFLQPATVRTAAAVANAATNLSKVAFNHCLEDEVFFHSSMVLLT
jgi:hypothetical protein